MSETLFVFNGVNATRGAYLTDPLPAADVSRLAQGEKLDPGHLAELIARERRETEKTFGVIAGIDPKDLSSAGWGVIFPHDSPAAIRDALRELLDHRRSQASRLRSNRYKEYAGFEGYRPAEGKRAFLARHGAAAGMPADPDKVPYYLLLVGSPGAIPFQFQYQLDVEYAVGRLWFEKADGSPDLDAFRCYARSVVTFETETTPRLARRAALFGVQNPGDGATALSTQHLINPLAARLAEDRKDWTYTVRVQEQARKADLSPLLGGPDTPALLLTASHGVGFDANDPRQLRHQGALLCQDWPGPRSMGQPIGPDFYFSADDVPDSARLLGLVAFHFACYGAGTPRLDDFPHLNILGGRETIAPRPFVAGLPQRLLGHPNGGALAVVGHVERAWSCSFFGGGKLGTQLQVFQSALTELLDGSPVGYALEFFNQYYAALSTDLSTELEDIKYGKAPDNQSLSEVWTANNDARSYLVLGDPAVRVRTARPADPPGPRSVIGAVAAGPATGSPPPTTPGPVIGPISVGPTVPPVVPAPSPAPGATTLTPAVFAVPAGARAARRQRLLLSLQGRRIDEAYTRPDIRRDLEDEAADTDPDQVVTADELAVAREFAQARAASEASAAPASFLFFSTDQVVIVPGFMASELSDVAPSGTGLIWLSPVIAFRDRLSTLQLASYDGSERDLKPGASVQATAAVPVVYDLLRADLEARRYTTVVHAVDWRKDLEMASERLADRLRALVPAGRPIHVIAHSQGALVARRALQKLAGTPAADAIKNLILLGPANFGTFSAVFAIAGTHSLLPTLRRFAVVPADGIQPVLASMTGIYQLLPWDPARVPWLAGNPIGRPEFWSAHVPIDAERLGRFFGWGRAVDSSAFNDRTTVILGDNSGAATSAGAAFQGNMLLPTTDGLAGDGTIPNSCAVLPGTATYVAPGTEHSRLATYRSVLAAIRAVLKGQAPALSRASSGPADHLTPLPFSEPAAAPASFGVPVAAATDTPGAAELAGLVRLAEAAAAAGGRRVRITIEADPPG